MTDDFNIPVYGVVLAAGKGTRMKSSKAKVLHELFFAPMIHHVVNLLAPLKLAETIIVTGHQRERVEASLADYNLSFAYQEKQLGTGDAVLSTEEVLINKSGVVLILCGDTPLIKSSTLSQMLQSHLESKSMVTVMSTEVEDPTNYGRIISHGSEGVEAIVEEKDATESQRKIKEINAGIYFVNLPFLFDTLKKVGNDNSQGEVYLTDIVSLANENNNKVSKFICEDPTEVIGVNSQVELAMAVKILQKRRNLQLMQNGVTMIDPDTTFVDYSVEIEEDVTLSPNVFISGNTVIRHGATLNPWVKLHDCIIANNTIVASFSDYTGKSID